MAKRIKEKEIEIPALRLAAMRSDGFISTSDLIIELTKIMKPEGVDLEFLKGRNDTKFSQKVRNLISHQKNINSIFSRGFAVYDSVRKGIVITKLGREYVS
jgi:hypothetical protein